MNYKTIPEMFFSVINSNINKNIMNYKKDNNWVGLSGGEIKDKVKSLSSALTSFGLIPNDKIAILSSTSYKWALCDYSILCSRMTTVTVYPTLVLDQVEYILKNFSSFFIY